MADGFNRFNPGHFSFNQNTRNLHHRPGSPLFNSRALLQPNADTPSPNRSPGTQSPAHNPYAMHNYNSHRQNHGLLNGASHNYQGQLLQKGFQSQQQNHHGHHMANHHQDHTGISHALYGNHQHTASGSTLTNTTPNFTPAHLQNGTPDNTSALGKPHPPHWTEQLRDYENLRSAEQKPHFYARNAPTVGRHPGATMSAVTQHADVDEHGDHRRLPQSEETEEPGAWSEMDLGGQGLKSMGPSIFRFYPQLKKIYFNHNRIRELPSNIGQMRSLTMLDLSFNELTSLPPEIGMLTNLKKLLLFGNDLRDLPSEIGYLSKLEMLGIEGNRYFNPDLKDRLVEYGTKELVRYMREEAQVPPPPNDREWISLVDDPENEAETFSVFSWNMLCDRGATQSAFGYTPSQALSWDHRKRVISDELRERNADIMALQEIDQESYNEYFRPNLAMEDYKGIFWPKTRAQTMADKEAKIVDGCAIFYKNSKYVLLDKHLIAYNRQALIRQDMKGEHDVYNRIMPKDNIAVVAFLENRATGSRVIAVNTHLVWEGWLADVKLVQVALLMEQLSQLAEKYAAWPPCKDKELFQYANADSADGTMPERLEPAPSQQYDNGTQIPLVICGDFNSTQHSGVFDLITQGSVSNSHQDLGTQKYGDLTKNGISHPFSLRSAYTNIRDWPWTNYVAHFREVIDYIWYSTNSLQVTGLLGQVDPEYMRRVPGFPNWHFPSDHLALYVEFAIKGRKEKRKPVEADFGNNSRRESRQQH
ncbi:glucose-repressible alcohol dehydrogenase-like protein transcriptional effector [Teratosphaeria nubilosa]|uniref:CCR4-Not complex 3'-5'-exoribonuclease subunit Ccr4 n=1 Tax=Teratosphaeria nubilosa TaxID=161662 RepID=A0A6G1LN03_9PEZI|nr:glucose-repressible alcohol dehydrogenase-like protein transcriptional effector [Teratosphaeria nubilosa]